MFINRSGTMVLPFMTMYCTQRLHFSIAQAGIVMAMFGAGSIAGAFIGGKLTDKFGFYTVQTAALLTGGILFITAGFLSTFPALCFGSFFLSLCNDAFRPANAAAVAWYSNENNRTRSYSLNRLAINLGWAAGGSIGGLLASIDYHLLFWVDGITNISAALIMTRMLPPVKSIVKQQQYPDKISHKAASAYKDRHYLIFIALTTCFATCFFQNFTMLPVFFKSEWHLSERLIGLLLASNGIIIVLFEMIMIHRLEGKRTHLSYIKFGVFVCGVSFAILNLFPPWIFTAFISICLISFGEMLSMPFMNSFWIVRTNESNRGEYAALYTIAWSTAQVIAPVLGSFIVYLYDFNTLWWLIAAICTITSLSYLFLNKSISQNK
jgi:predicted MFS family arabinose efflux permease